jgi:CO/xanthine dehydrogenase FAD-binding subunit
MRPFSYEVPTSVDQAISLLAREGGRARPLAGGTDLLVQMRRGLREADLLVDLKRIPELTHISFDPSEGLTVGAAVSCAQLYEHRDVQRAYPALIDAASIVGGPAIQGRATLGGNLCNAAPSGDTIPPMIVLDATCTIAGPSGRRNVAARSFCTAPGKNVLNVDEILVSIQFPSPEPRSGAHYLRFIPRGEMDIAVAAAGAWVALNDDGDRVVDARIALAAVAPIPLPADDAAASLVGKAPTEEAFEGAARLAQEAARPISDVRGTIAQRRHLVGVLVKRALRGAVARAKGVDVRSSQRGGSHG